MYWPPISARKRRCCGSAKPRAHVLAQLEWTRCTLAASCFPPPPAKLILKRNAGESPTQPWPPPLRLALVGFGQPTLQCHQCNAALSDGTRQVSLAIASSTASLGLTRLQGRDGRLRASGVKPPATPGATPPFPGTLSSIAAAAGHRLVTGARPQRVSRTSDDCHPPGCRRSEGVARHPTCRRTRRVRPTCWDPGRPPLPIQKPRPFPPTAGVPAGSVPARGDGVTDPEPWMW